MMNQTIFKRAAGFLTAFAMMMLVVLGAVPVKAAGMSVSASTSATVSAGNRFAANITISGSSTKNTTADVSVTGLGSITDSATKTGVSFDANGSASFTVSLTHSGDGSPAVLVEVNGESADCTVSGIFFGKDDGNDTPVKPSGNTFGVKNGTALPSISAGETKKLVLPISNLTSRRVPDATFTVELPEGVYVDGATFSQKLTFASKESKNLEIPLVASANAASGVSTMKITATYRYSGEMVTESFSVNLKVTGSTGQTGEGKLEVTGYSVNPGTVTAGNGCKLTLTVKNTGNNTVKNGAVTLGGLSTTGFTMNNSLDTQYITSLASGASTNLTFNLSTSSAMASGNYILDVSLTAGEATSAAKAFIPVKANSASGSDENGVPSGKPQIVIESYTYGSNGETSVTGGKVFTLSMKIKNAGKVAIENVKITVSSAADATTGGVFSPANSSNTFFVESIPAGGTIEESIDLLPKADAAPKSYGLDISFNYEAVVNKERIELSPTETISIPLTQPDRFEVGEVQMWGPVYVGDTLSGNVSYVNKGKSTIFNLSVKIEGDGFTTAETDNYIGNVESGSSDSFDISLNPTQAGTLKATLTFSYEDANGEVKEVVKDIESEVMEYEPVDPIGPDDPVGPVEPEKTGLPTWAWIAIIAGGVVVAVVVVVIVVKANKKKKQKALDAEDDYDDEDAEK